MKPSRFFVVGLFITVGWLTMYVNAQAGQPGQKKVIALDNFDLEQIEIVQENPDRHWTEMCRSKNEFKLFNKDKNEELGLIFIGICSQLNHLYSHTPSFFYIQIPLKTPDGIIKKVEWRINNFPDVERIISLLKERKFSHLKVRVSSQSLPMRNPDNSEKMITPEYFCETCEVLGFTLVR